MDCEVQQLMRQFTEHGFKIYLVGGYVRDTLLGVTSHDIDFATDATPEQIESLFAKTLSLGKAFGTVTIVMPQQTYEVTTFREDSEKSNHRKPEQVVYTNSLTADVKRRDFTINGLAMDEHGEIFDYVGGRRDLQQQLIRAIGEPQRRFREDALRILRAIRFAIRLEFTIELETWRALTTCADYLQAVAKERQRQEWTQIVACAHVDSALIPERVGEICFGPNWQKIIAFANETTHVQQFWTFVHLMTTQDWKYTKQERKLSQQVRQKQAEPESLRYLGMDFAQACELEQLIAAVNNCQYDQSIVEKNYANFQIRTLKDLAISGTDCQMAGIEKNQIKACLATCAQAINEQKIENTKQACLTLLEEVGYGKNVSINFN